MNIDEMIADYEKKEATRLYGNITMVPVSKVLTDLKKLSNVEYNHKVKLPQFIIDTMYGYDNLHDMLTEEYFNDSTEEIDSDDVQCWIGENFDKLCYAWLHQNSYEVEEDPKYYVAIPTEFDPLAKLYFVGFENVIDPLFIGYKEKAYKFDNFEKAKGIAKLTTGNVEKEVS